MRNPCRLLILALVLALAPAGTARAEKLFIIQKPALQEAFAGLRPVDGHYTDPFPVTIFKRTEFGECRTTPATCPKQELYISVSTSQQKREAATKLFRLAPAYGWKFLGWKNIPKNADKSSYLTFEVEMRIPNEEKGGEWWQERYFEIGVNPWAGYIKPIDARTVR